MSDAIPPSARDGRGRFQPGQSGNPAGKKPGTLNHTTRLKALLDDAQYDVVVRKVIDAATEGHWPSVRFLMERLVPKPRSQAIALDLPAGASRAARLTALVDLMCAGQITADQVRAMIAMIDVAGRAVVAETAAAVEAAPAPAPSRAATPAQAPSLDPAPARGGEKARGAETDGVLHSAWMSPAKAARGFDWRSSVSRQALTAGWPASDLHLAGGAGSAGRAA